MFGRQQELLSREALKPKRTAETLTRFGGYFKPYWLALVVVLGLVLISTWAQVTSPELLGQLVDCYLTPSVATALSGGTGFPGGGQTQPSNC